MRISFPPFGEPIIHFPKTSVGLVGRHLLPSNPQGREFRMTHEAVTVSMWCPDVC